MSRINQIIDKYRSMNHVAKATIWFVICSFIQRGITVISTPIFTRLLTKEEYGTFSVFSSWLEILTVIFTLRICYGVYMRNLVKYPDERDGYSSSLLGLTTILTGAWFVVYMLFSRPVNNFLKLSFPMMICMFIMILFSSAFSFWSARERVDYQYKKLIIISVLVSILKPVVGIVLVLSVQDNKVFARILGLTIVEVILYGILYVVQMRRGRAFYRKDYWLGALKFNLPLVPHYLSQIILNHSDRIMINSMCGEGDAGIYSLAYSMAMIMVLFNTSLQNTISPWNYEQLKKKNYPAMQRIGNLTALIIAVINFLLILVAPEMLRLFAPVSYHGALFVIPPVSMGVFFMYLYGLFVNVEMYYGKNYFVLTASVTGAVANIISNAIFIPIFGYIAAAYTTLGSFLLYSVMHGAFSEYIRRKEKVAERFYQYPVLFLITGIFLIGSFLIMMTYSIPVLRYSIVIAIAVVIILLRKKIRNLIKQFMGMRSK